MGAVDINSDTTQPYVANESGKVMTPRQETVCNRKAEGGNAACKKGAIEAPTAAVQAAAEATTTTEAATKAVAATTAEAAAAAAPEATPAAQATTTAASEASTEEVSEDPDPNHNLDPNHNPDPDRSPNPTAQMRLKIQGHTFAPHKLTLAGPCLNLNHTCSALCSHPKLTLSSYPFLHPYLYPIPNARRVPALLRKSLQSLSQKRWRVLQTATG